MLKLILLIPINWSKNYHHLKRRNVEIVYMHVCSIMTEYNLLEISAHNLHFLPENLASQTGETELYACIHSSKEYLMESLLCRVPGRGRFKSCRHNDEQESHELCPWEQGSHGDKK